jgi:hypothetical protein
MEDEYEIIGYVILEVEEVIGCLVLDDDYSSYIMIPL